jgi:hypothetical protein
LLSMDDLSPQSSTINLALILGINDSASRLKN